MGAPPTLDSQSTVGLASGGAIRWENTGKYTLNMEFIREKTGEPHESLGQTKLYVKGREDLPPSNP